jgi:hypothetical protein
LVQVRIKDRHGFQSECIVHQFGQLQPRFEMKVHLQRAPRELVEVVHLPAPGFRFPCMAGDARGEAADHQRHQHESQQRHGVGRISGQVCLGRVRGEVAMHQDRPEGDDHGLPESAQQGGRNHDEHVEQHCHGQQPSGPVRQSGYKNNRYHA